MLNISSSPQSQSVSYNPHLSSSSKDPAPLNEHALIGISTFNSYFSVENMEKLFFWADQNFDDFTVFFMDKVSMYNLMAMGYNEKKALEKVRSHDNHLTNKILRSLIKIDFSLEKSKKKLLLLSDISQNQKYIKIYKKCINLFERDNSFKNDCLDTTRAMLSGKMSEITEDALYTAVKYLFAELPLWFNTPYILNTNSSTFVYKELSSFWQKICYGYNLLSPNQQIMVKSVM